MINKNIELTLIKEGNFLGTKCDFYKDEENNIYMTREQIGQALGYSDPIRNISKIHQRNKERLDKFSFNIKIKSSDGKMYNTKLYNEKGILEIIRCSAQPMKNKEILLKCLGYSDEMINVILGLTNNILSKQHNLYSILINTYYDCDIKTEVVIDNYRVDFLLNNKIIIECDENGHIDRDIEYEKAREQHLKRLGYKIIRYNPDSNEFNKEYKLIKKINNEINKEYEIKYPNNKYNNFDLLIKMRKANQLYGGYIFDVDKFVKKLINIILTTKNVTFLKKIYMK